MGSRSRRRSRSRLRSRSPGGHPGCCSRSSEASAAAVRRCSPRRLRVSSRRGCAGRASSGSPRAAGSAGSGFRGPWRPSASCRGCSRRCQRPRWRSCIYPPGCGRWPLRDRACGHARGLLRADLPSDRPLAALAVAELRERRLAARVAPRPLGRVASRRAMAGLETGGAVARRVRRLARGLVGRTGAPAADRGQALLMVLGAAFAILFAASLLAALGGALTGTARAQRAVDLVALSGARSLRDDFPRLFTPPRLPGGAPNLRHLDRREYLARAAEAAQQAAARNGVDPDRLRLSFPDADSFAPLRLRAEVIASVDRGALPGQRGQLGRERIGRRRRHPDRGPRRGRGGVCTFTRANRRLARDRHRRRLLGTARLPAGQGHAPRCRRGVRPAGRRGAPGGISLVDHLGVSLRRRAGAPVRRASRPPLGGAAGPIASPLRDRARPRAVVRVPVAGRERARFGFLQALLLGALAFRLRRRARRPVPPRRTPRRPAHRGRRRRRRRRPSGLRARALPRRRSCAPRRAGTSPPGCWPRS